MTKLLFLLSLSTLISQAAFAYEVTPYKYAKGNPYFTLKCKDGKMHTNTWADGTRTITVFTGYWDAVDVGVKFCAGHGGYTTPTQTTNPTWGDRDVFGTSPAAAFPVGQDFNVRNIPVNNF